MDEIHRIGHGRGLLVHRNRSGLRSLSRLALRHDLLSYCKEALPVGAHWILEGQHSFGCRKGDAVSEIVLCPILYVCI